MIRLVKRAFQERGISMPDEAREILFPQGVPVRMLAEGEELAHAGAPSEAAARDRASAAAGAAASGAVTTKAEGGLSSEKGTLQEQARQAKPIGEAENLLGADADEPVATGD